MKNPPDRFNDLLLRVDERLVKGRRWAVGLFVGSFVLKLVYLLQSAGATHVTVPIMDSEYYFRMAEDIARGGVVRDDAFFMGPLYPYVMSVIFGIFGKSIMAIRVVQALAGSFTVVLTWMIGRRVVRPSAAMLAAILLALYGAMTFYEGQLLMMWLGTLLNLGMLWILMTRQTTGAAVWAGVLLGLSALARANILIMVVVVVPWLLFVQSSRHRWRRSAMFVAAVIVTILPATIHNLVASGDFVLITSNGGVNFFIGNNGDATGIFAPPKGINLVTDDAVKTYVERVLGRTVTPSELSQYWFSEAFLWMRTNPGAAFALLLRKAALYLNGYEVPQIESFDIARERYSIFKVLFVNMWSLMSLGLLGVIFSLREWRKHFLLLGYLVAFSISVILFFVTSRYRVQISPVLAIFAAYGLLSVLPGAVMNMRKGIGTLVLFLIIVLSTTPAFFALPKEDVMWREHTHEARRLSKLKQHEQALEEINKAVAIHPDYADSYVYRALIQKQAGHRLQAIEDYARAIDINPNIATVQYDFAQMLRQMKMYEPAIDAYRSAIELSPLMLEAYNNLGITYQLAQRYDDAAQYFEKVIDMDPAYIKAYNNLGALLAQTGNLDAAIQVLNRGVGVDPTYSNTYRNLAMVYIQKKDAPRAYAMMEQYVRLEPEDERSKKVLEQLRTVIESDSL